MDTNKMREQFEAWVLREYPNQTMGRFSDGEYHSTTVQYCWLAWQASREAVVVELPARKGIDHYCYDQGANCNAEGHNQCLVQVAAAIEAQGLKVKP